MADFPESLRYQSTHEWVRVEGDKAYVGISDHAQGELGDVVSIYLPKAGGSLKKGDKLAEIDSMKTSEVIYAPVSGRIEEVNEELDDVPEAINEDPYGKGWIVLILLEDKGEIESLLTASAYRDQLEEE